MKRIPQAVFIADIHHDAIALTEARKMKVPVIAITDTNTDPSLVDYPIPANDDATQAIEIIVGTMAEAIKEGKATQVAPAPKVEAAPAPIAAE